MMPLYYKIYNMSDFVDKADGRDAAFISIMISATTLLNLYRELSECRTKRKLRVWVNLHIAVKTGTARLFEEGVY